MRDQATVEANGCDIIEPFDLPIIKGLQERIHDFERSDEEIQLRSILDGLTARRRSISTTEMKPKPDSSP
nr:DUF1931 family protein [Azospirillum argentinense]